MSRIIFGIHGMGNKPPSKQLQTWWKAAIREGLKGRGSFWFFRFKLVYWASIVHHDALDPSCKDKSDPGFLREPYTKGSAVLPVQKNSTVKQRIRKHINDQLEKMLLEEDGTSHFNGLTDFILKHFVKDLDAYYRHSPDNASSARDEICRLLADTLRKNRRKKILLIAHSMGTIIAWDVLTQYVPDVKIDTLVTIGSPLGFPVVKSHLLADLKALGDSPKELRTPGNITGSWKNLADFKDRVATNADLTNDFLPNRLQVQPEDLFVYNNYEMEGDENHHKSYGYLRCPEMGLILSRFLKGKRMTFK
jgi:hypothetical protein